MAANIDYPWKRRIRLEITGLKGGASRDFESDGTQNKLRISARVHKQFGLAEPTQIMIWNLSPDTRAGFQRRETKIRLSAGWDKGPLASVQQCFYGELQNSESYRRDTDIVTNIYALSAVDTMASATACGTFKQGVEVSHVVRQLARDIVGEGKPVQIKSITAKIGEKGLSCSNSVRKELDALAKEHGFSWGVVDGVFYACYDKEQFDGAVTIESDYLIDVNPVFVSPLQYERGITWHCTFNPLILPFHGVEVKTSLPEMQQKYGGVYRVNEVVHDLDCFNPRSFTTRGMAFYLSREAGGNG